MHPIRCQTQPSSTSILTFESFPRARIHRPCSAPYYVYPAFGQLNEPILQAFAKQTRTTASLAAAAARRLAKCTHYIMPCCTLHVRVRGPFPVTRGHRSTDGRRRICIQVVQTAHFGLKRTGIRGGVGYSTFSVRRGVALKRRTAVPVVWHGEAQ